MRFTGNRVRPALRRLVAKELTTVIEMAAFGPAIEAGDA